MFFRPTVSANSLFCHGCMMLRVIVFRALVLRGFGSGSECASSHSSRVYTFPNRCMKFDSLFSNTAAKGGAHVLAAAGFAVAAGWG
jgi:hypothetical protein